MSTAELRSVLYVDDEPDIRQIVQISLELSRTMTVHTAESGEQALVVARAVLPDLVLLDVMMPKLDGPGTLHRMRQDPVLAAVPVIFMTAKAMPGEIAHLYSLGAAGVIAKPFDPMLLAGQVTALWNEYSSNAIAPPEDVDHPGLRRQVIWLGKRFLSRTREDALRLRGMVSHIQPPDPAVIDELERLAHRIRGSSATFGFSAVSECAKEIENLTEDLKMSDESGDTTSGSRTRLNLDKCAERLMHEVDAAASLAG
jgi:CheY-like chemotaxis protein